jgi:DNA-binding response OmpR family regulator
LSARTLRGSFIHVAAVPRPSTKPSDTAPVLVIVDDDPDIRAMLVKALGTTYTVYEARDGEEARILVTSLPPPDGVVCDIMMPRLDGLSFAKAVRKVPALERLPILFLTAKDSPLDIIKGINAGARHYLTKPFKISEVVAKVNAMTAKK